MKESSNKFASLLGFLLVYLITVSIITVLIMVIWNNVLIQKVKGAQLQKLDFWEALAIGVFCSISFKSVNYCFNGLNTVNSVKYEYRE